jgi:hypothetical protein
MLAIGLQPHIKRCGVIRSDFYLLAGWGKTICSHENVV